MGAGVFEAITAAAAANPELTVIAVYSLAVFLVWQQWMAGINNIPLPLVSQLNLAGALVVGISFWYHYVVISASTGVQSLFQTITSVVGIGIFSVLIGREAYTQLT